MRSLAYGNPSSIRQHEDLVWEKLKENVRGNNVNIVDKQAAAEIEGLRVSPLGAMITKKARAGKCSTFNRLDRDIDSSAFIVET